MNAEIHVVEEGVTAYYRGITQSLGGKFVDEIDGLVWFRTGRSSLIRFNGVLQAHIPIEKLSEIARPILMDFRKDNLPFFWADFPPGATSGIREFLEANGIQLVIKGMPAMTRSLGDVPSLPPLGGMSISEVLSPSDRSDWLDVHMEGFNEPTESRPDFGDFLEHTASRPEWQHYIARWDGVPCAISTLLCTQEAAGIYHVTTLPAYRGRGLGRSLTLKAMQAGKDRGYSQSLLFATTDGFPLYQKLGFKTVVTADLYAWVGDQA